MFYVFQLKFQGKRGSSLARDIAIDEVKVASSCSGIHFNIPVMLGILKSYNFWSRFVTRFNIYSSLDLCPRDAVITKAFIIVLCNSFFKNVPKKTLTVARIYIRFM